MRSRDNSPLPATNPAFPANPLFDEQVQHLAEAHFLVLLWAAQGEDRKIRYNITNCFDDLKHVGLTRTKQTAVAIVDTLRALRFIDLRDEGNRKNLYITTHGARAPCVVM